LAAGDLLVDVISSLDGVANDGGNIDLVAGANVTITPNDGANTITIAATDTDTQLSEEQVEDFVGGMLTGNTETGITVTYEDTDGTIDFVATDPSLSNEGSLTVGAGTSTTSTISSNTSGSTAVTLEAGTNITLSETGNTITIASTAAGISDGDKGDITVSSSGTAWNIDAGVVGSTEVTDNSLAAGDLAVDVVSSLDGVANDGGNIDLVAGANVTITPNDGANTITIAATDTDTQLSEEQVEDFVGGMLTGNTETGITVTYEDTDGTIDFVATDPSLSNEGSLTVGAGTSTTSTISSNTSGSTAVTLEAGTNITLSETGNTITIAAAGGGGGSPSVITPSTITAQQDNYSPTGWADATFVRLSGDIDMDAITGFSAETSGEVKTLGNVGDYTIFISPENTSSTAANRISYPEDILLEPGESMQIIYDGTLTRWVPLSCPSKGFSNIRRSWFANKSSGRAAEGIADDINILFAYSGGSISSQSSTATTPLSAWALATGTTTTGDCYGYMAKGSENMGYIGSAYMYTECLFQLEDLSDGTNGYDLYFRLTTSPSSTSVTANNSLGIRYSDDVNSGKLEAFTRNSSGTETTLDLGVTVAADTPYRLGVSINKAGTLATFFVNDNVVGQITTNLPSGTDLGTAFFIKKTAGTTSRTAYLFRILGVAVLP
jgi:hypothetical protein